MFSYSGTAPSSSSSSSILLYTCSKVGTYAGHFFKESPERESSSFASALGGGSSLVSSPGCSLLVSARSSPSKEFLGEFQAKDDYRDNRGIVFKGRQK